MTPTIELDGGSIRLDTSGTLVTALRSGEREVQVPNARSWKVIDGGIVLLTKGIEPEGDELFTIPSPEQNVARLDSALELVWIVDRSDDHAESAGGYSHRRFFDVEDRIVTKASTGRTFEIDPETGAIENSYPGDEFVIAGRRHEFKYAVDFVASAGDRQVVAANGPEFGSRVYAFDADGTELWQRGFGKGLMDIVTTTDTVTAVRRTAQNSVLDAETGEIVD